MQKLFEPNENKNKNRRVHCEKSLYKRSGLLRLRKCDPRNVRFTFALVKGAIGK